MSVKTLDDLFVHLLRDVIYAERQIHRALPKMARNAKSDELRSAFEQHRQETEGQIDRLEKIFEKLDQTPRGVKCDAILGIIAEAEDQMDEIDDADVRDAALLSTAQAVEHYEISRYGTLIAYARKLNKDKDIQDHLAKTLKEEEDTDAKLTKLAESVVNERAAA